MADTFLNDDGLLYYMVKLKSIFVKQESGKGLSTNDFTNAYKTNVDNNTSARHTHANKAVLDGITKDDVDKWNTPQDLSGYWAKADLTAITNERIDEICQ